MFTCLPDAAVARLGRRLALPAGAVNERRIASSE
jgi:hypothetical protein